MIPTFQQCLELVEQVPLFTHKKQEKYGYTVHSFKYYGFPTIEEWELPCALNMRGITFINGNVVALPFEKFFNYKENKRSDVDLDEFQYASEKIDGSLISVFRYPNGKLDVKTMKTIESDVANEARHLFFDIPNIEKYCHKLLDDGYSPMFEYVSESSKIVLDYGGSYFYFLGYRDMITGKYFPPFKINELPTGVRFPQSFFDIEEVSNFVQRKGVEGVVLTVNDGTTIKIKSKEYCELHKIISLVTPKIIIDAYKNNKVDDYIGILKEHQLYNYIDMYEDIRQEIVSEINKFYYECKDYLEYNKEKTDKEIAIELKSNKRMLNGVFAIKKGKEYRIEEMVVKEIEEKYKKLEG